MTVTEQSEKQQKSGGTATGKYEISEKVCRQATLCIKDQSCIKGEKECLCKVEHFISDRYLFVRRNGSSGTCPYHVSFGFSSSVCGCPVRNALYQRYGV